MSSKPYAEGTGDRIRVKQPRQGIPGDLCGRNGTDDGEGNILPEALRKEEKQKWAEIAAIPLFQGLSPQTLPALFGCLNAHERSYRRGEVIILEEDRVQSIGVVRKGSVLMTKEDVWGNRTILDRMGRGELLGETFAVNYSQVSCVTFEAAAESSILFLSFEHLLHTCRRSCGFHHRVIENLMDLVSRKNIRLMEKIEIISKGTLREKILAYLSIQSQKQQSARVTVPLSRGELAEYLDANRSAMTRELSAMKRDGLIDFEKNEFVLHPAPAYQRRGTKGQRPAQA